MFLIVGAFYAYAWNNSAVTLSVATNTTDLKNLSKQYDILIDRLQTIRAEQNAHSSDIKGLQKDVASLSADTRIITEKLNAQVSQIFGFQRDLVEVESQFCSEDAMRNLMHATDLRSMAMLWNKAFGIDMPTANAYYPKIGRCDQAR